ncbi:MAG: hypothetical protein PWQ82_182 [Thermosediminibacterales bacterium]|nr:hypothetical protein [Thermosediminibacterales bacterium]MDK2835347.1 hypothetical protein [Thermosediminibacterales bacterium]
MPEKKHECIDAGSEYCPCYLAEVNECITCSQLQGKSFCDCNWRGVCIYQEYVWAGNKSKALRKEYIGEVLERIPLTDDAMILKIRVTKTKARELKQPGSYIFLRDLKKPDFFNVPMSIMYADEIEGIIYVAVQILGIKTKAIQAVEDSIVIRGPYWNGLLGQRYIKQTFDSECLMILRGISQAPAILVINKLVSQRNQVKVIVDPGKIGKIFIYDFINKEKVEVIEQDFLSQEGWKKISTELSNKNLSLVYSGGSDKQHLEILTEMEKNNSNAYLVVTNNSEMCCGEGVCGSCSTKIDDNVTVKVCKVQLDVRKAIERRILQHG